MCKGPIQLAHLLLKNFRCKQELENLQKAKICKKGLELFTYKRTSNIYRGKKGEFKFSVYFCGKNNKEKLNNNVPEQVLKKASLPTMFASTFICTLFRNKRFILNLIPQQNASKFAIIYEYKNPKLLFPFFIS